MDGLQRSCTESDEVILMLRLTAHDLGHRFGRNVLFRDLNMEVEEGETVAVTGSNGSGKSTLLHILAGLLTPAAGEVRLMLNRAPVDPDERPFACGFVAPYLNVYEGYSVRENLDFLARARHLADRRERISSVIEEVGLVDRADDLVATFSSGMKQRVRLAVATLARPPVLLLDEPGTTLDAPGKAVVERLRRRQIEGGGLVIIATNDESEARSCDRRIDVESFRPVSSARARRRQP